MQSRPLITRVVLKNYKSIAFCDVKLGPLSILVGPNGAGKSNFLDALRFLSEAMTPPLEKVLQNRGGFSNILRRGPLRESHLGIRIEFVTREEIAGYYSIRFKSDSVSDYLVEREKCVVDRLVVFDVENGVLRPSSRYVAAPQPSSRLYLPYMAQYPESSPVFDLLDQCQFYNFNPEQFRLPIPSENARRVLRSDGANLTNVVNYIWLQHPTVYERITQYLRAINPALKEIEPVERSGYRSLEFIFDLIEGSLSPRQTSDGTIRALAVLVALFQRLVETPVSLVGLEEPETALHPAASGVLFDAMREASASVQVIATTHSADLLEKKELDTDAILAVEMRGGTTRIDTVDEPGKEALRNRLYSAGELMRMNYLRPQVETEIEPDLFGDLVPA